MSKPRLATVWLDGCSGCHMSFLDMDERLLEIAERADIVYSPLVDTKEYPADVDVCLVEGAVSSEDDLHKIRLVRERTKTLVSFGDCAVTANVPGMRNPIGVRPLLERAYLENVTLDPRIPLDVVPALLPMARPVASRRQRRRLPPGLSAVGRSHLPRARRPDRGPDAGHDGRPLRPLRGT